MKDKLLQFLFITAMVALSACTTTVYPEEPVRFDSDLIKVQVEKIKIKSKYYQVQSRVQNKTEKNLVIMFNSIECFCDNLAGKPQYVLGIGERDIDLQPLATKNLQFMCKFTRPVECRDMKMAITGIFDNPSGDGRTRGDMLGKNISFKLN